MAGMLALTATASFAAGEGNGVVLVSDRVDLSPSSQGTATAKAVLINPTAADVPVRVRIVPPSPGGCSVSVPANTVVPAHRQQEVTVSAEGCPDGRDGTVWFTLTAGGLSFPMKAARAPESRPHWNSLYYAFGAAGLAALTVCFLEYLYFTKGEATEGSVPSGPRPSGPRSATTNPAKRPGRTPGTQLVLDKSWDFTKSWAGNVTVVAAAFAGVFGSSGVMTALFGKDAGSNAIAVITVAAAIAVGVVGAAPLFLGAFGEERPALPNLNPPRPVWLGIPVWALLAAASLTLTAAGGELAAIVLAATLELRLSTTQQVLVWVTGALGGLLLIKYAQQTLYQLITYSPTADEQDKADQEDMAAADKAAEVTAAALEHAKEQRVMPPAPVPAAASASMPRHRSALL
jgi:hypothetical protein